MTRRDLLAFAAGGALAGCGRQPVPVAPGGVMPHPRYEVAAARGDGRVLVADSLTFADDSVGPGDVFVGGSFAGAATVALALRRGVRAVVAHEAGVGKDEAGVSGLPLADTVGVPTVAVETMSARLADGRSLYAGRVGRANRTAAALGVRPGQPVTEAAELLLAAPPGRPAEVPGAADETLHTIAETDRGRIIAVWSLLLVPAEQRADVFCAASHAGTTMAAYAKPVMPRGVIANDAGRALDDSGVAGLAVLDGLGVAAAAVGCMTARIGDGLSTHRDGVISAVNRLAAARGVSQGMPAREAALRLLNGGG